MTCRVAANFFKQIFREQAEQEGTFRQESFIFTACKFYNKLIEASGEIWKNPKLMKALLAEKFGEECLSEKEKSEGYHLGDQMVLSDLFRALEERTGVLLKESVLTRFSKIEKIQKSAHRVEIGSVAEWDEFAELEGISFEFVPDDFEAIKSSVKGLKLASLAIREAIQQQAISGKKSAKEKLGLLFIAARMMEEGSKGDIEGLIKYLELRLEITGFIVNNPDLLKGDLSDVMKHIERLKKIFGEVEDLCEFNETEIPRKLEFLRLQSRLQEFYVKYSFFFPIPLNSSIKKRSTRARKLTRRR